MFEEPNNEQIQAVIQLDALQSVMVELHDMINEPSVETKISAWDLFCQKTGNKIGFRSENSLLLLVKICGTDVVGNLYNSTTLNVHPAWIETSPDCLEALMEDDPIGFSCYCFSLLTAQFYQRNKNFDARLYPASDRYWALARANALMSERGNASLAELCAELARAVTFMPDSGVHLFNAISKFGNTPDKLAQLHCSGELIYKLRDATNRTMSSLGQSRAYVKHWVQRTRFIDLAATPEDAARGPTNVRKMRVSKRHVADAAMFNEIDKLFASQGFDLKQQILDNTPGSTKWRENVATRAAQREAEIELGLSSLMDFTNLTLSDEDDDDDQTVEYRTLATTQEHSEAAEPPVQGIINQTNNNTSDTSDTSDMEIAADIVQTINDAPINSIMVKIAKSVLENVVVQPEPKLTALQILRAKKGL